MESPIQKEYISSSDNNTQKRSPLILTGLPKYYQIEFIKIHETNEAYKGSNWYQFNGVAFLFGPLWALIKGIWLAPLISFIVVSITTVIGIPWLGAIFYWFIFARRGNYMYYCAYVKKKQIPI